MDFRIFLAPIWGFSTKKGFTFRESPNFVIPFGTKNHEMRGPSVLQCLSQELYHKMTPKSMILVHIIRVLPKSTNKHCPPNMLL